METIGLTTLVIICYMIGELFKVMFNKNLEKKKYIPVIVGMSGGILGCLCYFVCPEVIKNPSNPIDAIAFGILSGLSATGSNQIIKQMTNKKDP